LTDSFGCSKKSDMGFSFRVLKYLFFENEH